MRTALILALLALAGGASANRRSVMPIVPGVFTTVAPVVAVQQVQPVVVPVSIDGRGGEGGGLVRTLALARSPAPSRTPIFQRRSPFHLEPKKKRFFTQKKKKKVAQPVVYQVAQPVVYQPVVQQVMAPAPIMYAAPVAAAPQQVVSNVYAADEAGK